jgi:hypothetical protein
VVSLGAVVAVAGIVFLAILGWGEYKEWRGQIQGKAIQRIDTIPLIEQECRRRDDYWLNVLRTHRIEPAQPPPVAIVLQLPDGTEIRTKPKPRLPKETK